MKYLIIALSLAFILTGKAFALTPEEEAYFSLKGKALTPEQEDYFSKMETGKCWGRRWRRANVGVYVPTARRWRSAYRVACPITGFSTSLV